MLGLGTLFVGVANTVFAADGDRRLEAAIGISGWGLALLFGAQEFNRALTANGPAEQQRFRRRSLLLATVGLVIILICATQVRAAQYRRQLQQEYSGRGMNLWSGDGRDHLQVWKVELFDGEVSEEDVAKLRLAWPDATICSKYPREIRWP